MTTSKNLIILEGPDGSGKSTLARRYAQELGFRVLHAGPFPGVDMELPRFYQDMMLPALQGYENVVMDRSWISEEVYGNAYRNGSNRVGRVYRRMLERVAYRCETTVVFCLPPKAVAFDNWQKRKGKEYLKTVDAFNKVFNDYQQRSHDGSLTSLPTAYYDFTKNGDDFPSKTFCLPHRTALSSAGNIEAPFVLVGDGFGNPKGTDSYFQYPFVSFSNQGVSSWFTRQLDDAGISERSLLWLNSDGPLDEILALINHEPRKLVVIMGTAASERLIPIIDSIGEYIIVAHPQYSKRFMYHENVELDIITRIKEKL